MQQQQTAAVHADSYILLTAWLKECARAHGIKSLAAQTAYCLIYGHTVNSPARCFFGTVETVQYWTEAASDNTARKHLAELVNAGLIEKTTINHDGRQRTAYRAVLSKAEQYRVDPSKIEPSKIEPSKIAGSIPQNLRYDPSKIEGNNIDDNIEDIIKEETRDTRAREDAGKILAEASMQPAAQISGLAATTARPLPRSAVDVGKYLQSLPNCPPSPLRDDIATAFFDGFEATGWISTKGLPIRDWQAMARIYLTRWVNNERDKLAQQHLQRQQQQPRQYSKPATAPKPTAPQQPQPLTEDDKAKIRKYTDRVVKERGVEDGLQYCWRCDLGKAKTAEQDRQYWYAYIAEKYGVTNFTPQQETQQ